MTKYRVVEQFHRGGMCRVGDVVELTDTEAAELAEFVVPADGGSMPTATVPNAELQGQIEELEGTNADLAKRLDSSSFEIADLKQQIADLLAENEQLKAACPAKPAAKGAK